MLPSCGDSASSVKENQYLGSLPSIFTDYSTKKETYQADVKQEVEKLASGGEKNLDKIVKLGKESDLELKKMESDFDEAVTKECKKVAGRTIPTTFSEKLKNSPELFYDVAPIVTFCQKTNLRIPLKFTAKSDFTVPRLESLSYKICYRYVGLNGTTIKGSRMMIMPIEQSASEQQFKTGDVLNEQSLDILSFRYVATELADFSGIEFITEEEFKTL